MPPRRAWWLPPVLLLIAAFAAWVARPLDRYRPLHGDESWNMSVAYQLATTGRFGSPMYAGFFHADERYFIAPPLHHFPLTLAFRLWGAGIWQARAVSLLAVLGLLGIVTALAHRWYGGAVALGSVALLVAWPSTLLHLPPGVPLLAVARSARYDASTVAWLWVALGCLTVWLRRPRRGWALGAGLAGGAAALTHFLGLFSLPLLAWLGWREGPRARRYAGLAWMGIGAATVMLPYALYAWTYRADLAGQNMFRGDRFALGDPTFYLTNLLREPLRYARLWREPSVGSLLFLALVAPALVTLWRDARRPDAWGSRILWASIWVVGGLLALLEETKAPLYAVVLVPSLTLAVARFLVSVWRAAGDARGPLRRAGRAAVVGALLLVALSGADAYFDDFRGARGVRPYDDLAREMEAHIPDDATVVGHERWWWALHEHRYLALNNVWGQWEAQHRRGAAPPWPRFIEPLHVGVIVWAPDDDADLARWYSDALATQVRAYLATCTEARTDLTDPTYGPIQILLVRADCSVE